MFSSQRDNRDQRRLFSRRALLLGGAQLAGFGIIAARLYELQVRRTSQYVPLAEDNRVSLQLMAPTRGRILDRFGDLLADNEEGYRVILVPSLARNVRDILQRLALHVQLPQEEQDKLIARARRQQSNVPLIVASDLTFEQIARLGLYAPELPGVQVEAATSRKYLAGDVVAHVVGHVGSIEKVGIDDDPMLKLPGMRIGRTGIERGLDERLRGRAGTIKYEVDARGRIVRTLSQDDPVRGDDIALTIDTGLQAAVAERLSREKRAASVGIDTVTGDVVHMVSMPTHDPGELVRRVSHGAWAQIQAKIQERGNEPMVNRAIRGLYPPGSTFKMVTALAALETGAMNLTTKVVCEGQVSLGAQTFRCWKRSGHGACDFHRALRESCDCYFYEAARRTGIEALGAMARGLGFGQTYETGLALQKPGTIPDPDWKRGRFNKPWLPGETLLAGIGQGYVLTTPLQLAVMTARIASGRAIIPQFLRPEVGEERPAFEPLGIADGSLEAVRRAMTAVVNEDGGTGSNAQLGSGKPLVAGKTGTAQVARASSNRDGPSLSWEQRDHALFVAYVPANKPRYAVSLVVEHGGGGGATAGPVMRDIIAEMLARDPAAKPSYPDVSTAQPVAPKVRGRA